MVLLSVWGVREVHHALKRLIHPLCGGKIGTFWCRIGPYLFDSLCTLSSSPCHNIRQVVEAKFRAVCPFLRDSVATLRLVEVDDIGFRSGHTDNRIAMDAQDMTLTVPNWHKTTTNSAQGLSETKGCVVLTSERNERGGSYS